MENLNYHYYFRETITVDPRGRPQSRLVVITILTQIFRLSVRPLQNFNMERKLTASQDCGLAEWIIDDSCLVLVCHYYYVVCPW